MVCPLSRANQRACRTSVLALLLAALGPSEAWTQTSSVQFQEVAATAGIDFIHWNGRVPQGTYGSARCAMVTHGGAAVGDYDNDGWPDLYVTRMNVPNLLYHNRGDGTFEEVGAQAGVDISTFGAGCLWVDVDDDGDLDLYVMTFDDYGRNYLFMNDGAGGFSEEAESRNLAFVNTSRFPRIYTSTLAGDYDLDGDVDLVMLAWDPRPLNTLMDNDGTGIFTDRTEPANLFQPPRNFMLGFGGYFADFDDDGYPDLAVSADFGTSRLARNRGNRRFQDVT
ncbi:MAG: VCBS repeat-containing protein, partial [Planctomycetota bacterium]